MQNAECKRQKAKGKRRITKTYGKQHSARDASIVERHACQEVHRRQYGGKKAMVAFDPRERVEDREDQHRCERHQAYDIGS
jgi:hypothetical protein